MSGVTEKMYEKSIKTVDAKRKAEQYEEQY
jgi:hypothetical protein